MTSKKSLDIISVGDANIDLLMKVPHHPDLQSHGELGSGVRGSAYHIGCGGVAVNVAAGMARLGNRTGFVGTIGDDDLGETFRQNLTHQAIDISHLHILPDEATSLACIFEQEDGQSVFYVCPGTRYIPSECLPEPYIASARMLFMVGHMLTQDEVTGNALLQAIEIAREYGVIVALDPGKYWLNQELTSYVRQAIKMADILLPNDNEAELLTGKKHAEDAARMLLDEGVDIVAVKMAGQGSVICSREEQFTVPAFKTRVHSSLGAGDAFNSGFLHGYLKQWPLEKAGLFASATAGLKIRHLGTQGGLPAEKEVEVFLKTVI